MIICALATYHCISTALAGYLELIVCSVTGTSRARGVRQGQKHWIASSKLKILHAAIPRVARTARLQRAMSLPQPILRDALIRNQLSILFSFRSVKEPMMGLSSGKIQRAASKMFAMLNHPWLLWDHLEYWQLSVKLRGAMLQPTAHKALVKAQLNA